MYSQELTENSLTREQESSLVTTTMFWRRWTRAHIVNAPPAVMLPSLCAVPDLLDRDVVVVGGGWTLDNDIDDLRETQDRVTIICASQATKALVGSGIRPDIVLSLEHADISYQFDGLAIDDVGIHVLPLWSHENIIGLFNNAFFSVAGTGLLLENFHRLYNEDAYLAPGSSVGSGMIFLANRLGAHRVFLLGMDFCLQGDRTYAMGCADGAEKIEIDGDKYNSGAMSKWAKIHTDNPQFADIYGWNDIPTLRGQDGSRLRTLHPVALAHSHVVEAVQMCPRLDVVNCSIGGADIPGARVEMYKGQTIASDSKSKTDVECRTRDATPVIRELDKARAWALKLMDAEYREKALYSRPDLAMLLPPSICKYGIHLDKNMLSIQAINKSRLAEACEQISCEVQGATEWAIEQLLSQ